MQEFFSLEGWFDQAAFAEVGDMWDNGICTGAGVTDPAGNTSEFSMVDTDADGLADAWEMHGIDANEDGVVPFI